MHTLARQLRYTLRQLGKNPGSSASAVVTMALGIALVTSMFSLIDGVLLKGLPFPEPEEIVAVWGNNLSRDVERDGIPQHDFEDFRERQTSFEGMAGYTGGTFNLADEGPPDRYNGSWLSANALELLQVRAHIGRVFEPGDDEPGHEPVLLLGYHVWQKRYGGDPAVLGQIVRVNSKPATVVGVMPEGFLFPNDSDAWMPLVLETHEKPRGQAASLSAFARLRDGVTIDRATTDLATLAQRLADEYPATNEGVGVAVEPFVRSFLGDETVLLLNVMMGAVVLVLLVACFNVTNLLLGRAFGRSRELAIRSALGSARWRTVGIVLAESTLIAAAGAVLGTLLSHYALQALNAAIEPTNPPFWFDIGLSARVLLFTTALTGLAALAAGLVPALKVSKNDLSQILQDTTRGTTSFRLGRLSRALVVAEVAISCALLVGAALMIRSVIKINGYDLKIDSDNVLTARVGLFEGDYPEEDDWLRFFERVQEDVASRPEVARVAIGTTVPAETEIGAGETRFERPDETYERPIDMPSARLTAISPGYFETFGLPILAGRDFTSADRGGGGARLRRGGSAAVALVNEGFARREWPGESPIGQRINLWLGDEKEQKDPDAGWVEVVGVVPDLRFADFDNDDDQQAIYVPLAYQPPRFAWIITKTHTEAKLFAEPLRRTVLRIDPNLPLYFVHTMDEVIRRTMFFNNLFATFFSIFGIVALILGSVGLYGVLAASVGQRTQEMGVRMAFGARSADLLSMVLKQGLTQVSLGVAIGLALSAGIASVLAVFLFQVEPRDPVTFVAVPAILFLVAAAACAVPAGRASAIDPLEALRHE